MGSPPDRWRWVGPPLNLIRLPWSMHKISHKQPKPTPTLTIISTRIIITAMIMVLVGTLSIFNIYTYQPRVGHNFYLIHPKVLRTILTAIAIFIRTLYPSPNRLIRLLSIKGGVLLSTPEPQIVTYPRVSVRNLWRYGKQQQKGNSVIIPMVPCTWPRNRSSNCRPSYSNYK